MLWKLLKYDFRSMWKQFAIFWPVVIVLGLVNRFTLFEGGQWSTAGAGGMVSMAAMVLLIGGLTAMGAAALVFILQRFYKGLLGDEGYLMHTLPVQPWQLIASKLICAVVVTILSGIVATLAMMVMVPVQWNEIFMQINDVSAIFVVWRETGMTQLCLFMLLGLVNGILMLYFSMALGHLFSKHRAAMSVVAFLVLNVLLSNLASVTRFWDLSFNGDGGIWFAIAYKAVLSVIYFVGTNLILSKKLNLE